MFTRLSPKTRTTAIGGTIALLLAAISAFAPVDYVALGQGSTVDTLGAADGQPVISITARAGQQLPAQVEAALAERYPNSHLNMTTVSVTDKVTAFGALIMWLSGDFSLVPRDEVYPPNKSEQQVEQENAQMFADSQSAAEIAALRYLGYPARTFVGNIAADSPSKGLLDPQDQIVAVDGKPVSTFKSLTELMGGTKPGQTVTVTVLREDTEHPVQVVLGSSQQLPDRGYLGIVPQERPVAPFSVHISLAGIGGPSAGLMFTLGIIDRLTPGDLTSGHYIAGTGEIHPQDPAAPAAVGAIGGIVLKMAAARAAGATVFFVPKDNCQEALTQIPKGLQLVQVATLNDAMDALTALKEGRTPTSCG